MRILPRLLSSCVATSRPLASWLLCRHLQNESCGPRPVPLSGDSSLLVSLPVMVSSQGWGSGSLHTPSPYSVDEAPPSPGEIGAKEEREPCSPGAGGLSLRTRAVLFLWAPREAEPETRIEWKEFVREATPRNTWSGKQTGVKGRGSQRRLQSCRGPPGGSREASASFH